MIELFHSLIEINYISGKLKCYIALGSSYNLPNIYMACCPRYILPKTNEDNARSTKPKT